MAPIGYTTGALDDTEFTEFVDILRKRKNSAIEFSALREHELLPMLDMLENTRLEDFAHVSFHAPSKRVELSERDLVKLLSRVVRKNVPVVLHPDMIEEPSLWHPFGASLCIENMDKRKSAGRTAAELEAIFVKLPDASMCFDFAHAYQIDPTLCEAQKMLKMFAPRIREIHLSSLNSNCGHQALSYDTLLAFKSIASLIPSDVPIVLEAPVTMALRIHEIDTASTFIKEAFEGVA